MEILRIDVSKKSEGFDELYDILEGIQQREEGSFLIYSGSFIIITKNENIMELLDGIDDITIFKIKDIKEDIDREYVRTWLREEISKLEMARIKEEVMERTSAMYDILLEAEKFLKDKEEQDKQNGLQKAKPKTTKKSKAKQ